MIKQVVEDWTNQKTIDLKASFKSRGLTATGKTVNSVESKIVITDSNINIKFTGDYQTQYLINGRPKNKKQDHISLRNFAVWAGNTWMKDYVERKGLNVNPIGAAYNLGKYGVKVPNSRNDGKVVSSVFTAKDIKTLTDQLKDELILSIKTAIRK